jgi:hypothetical protein
MQKAEIENWTDSRIKDEIVIVLKLNKKYRVEASKIATDQMESFRIDLDDLPEVLRETIIEKKMYDILKDAAMELCEVENPYTAIPNLEVFLNGEPVKEDKALENRHFKDLKKTKEEITKILLLPSKAMLTREKYARVCDIVYKHLSLNGKFYFDEVREYGYWFDDESKQLWQLEAEKFCSFLSDRLGLNQKDRVFDWVTSALKDHISQHAPKVEPQIYSYFDPHRFTLYVNNKPGRVLKIDEMMIKEIDNGEGCLFLWSEDWQEFDYGNSNGSTIENLVYSEHSLDSSQGLKIDELSILLDTYIQTIFFRTIVLHRPLLAYIGPFGCGKTLMLVLIGIVLFGENFEVLGLEEQKQDAAIAYVTNSVFGVFDNADEKMKWLPDLLARVATRSKIPRRKLYTTNELVKYPVDCLLGITARMTPWARPDVISRMLPVKFKPPNCFHDENKLKQTVIEHRDELISALISQSQVIVKKLKETESSTYDSPSRLAGFYSFGMRSTKDPKSFKDAFSKALGIQNSVAAEEEEILVAISQAWLESWIGAKDVNGELKQWTDYRTTTQLLGELNQSAKNANIEFAFRNTKNLTHRIKENETMLRTGGIMFQVNHSNSGTSWKFKIPEKRRDAAAET